MARNIPKQLQNGLVLWLDGTGNDLSGNWNNGTLVNAPTKVRVLQNDGLGYNGSNQYVTVPQPYNFSNTNQLSFGCWVYPTNAWFSMANISKVDGGTNQFFIANNGNQVNWQIFWNDATSSYATAEGSIPSNKWSFVFITYDWANIQHYINSALISTTAVAKSINAATSPVYWTWSNGSGLHFWSGKIINPLLYNRALSPTEVQLLHKATFIK